MTTGSVPQYMAFSHLRLDAERLRHEADATHAASKATQDEQEHVRLDQLAQHLHWEANVLEHQAERLFVAFRNAA